MKFPFLLSEILRGAWAIEPRLALSYGPLIANLLDGKDISADIQKTSAGIYALSDSEEKGSSYDDAPKGSIAIIPLKGTMRKYGGLCSYGTEEISEYMREAADHPNIDAIILDTDSGGGAVDAVAPMIDAIRYSQSKGKPVIAFADLAASAAYWVASECNMIIASNDISAEFGSIGVMVSFADMAPYYEKEGVKVHTVYAPESTHKNLPLENAMRGDYQLLQDEVLSPLAKQFQKTIKKNRKDKLDDKVEGILNGRMFFAADALKFGLIDKIGNLSVAVKEAKKLSIAIQFNNNPKF